MSYDPFPRGPHPVRVGSAHPHDASRARSLAAEVWDPATAAHLRHDRRDATRDRNAVLPAFPPVAQDAAPAAGPFPVIVSSHGFAAHCRHATDRATQSGSHGDLAAAPNHTGDTLVGAFFGAPAVSAGVVEPITQRGIEIELA